MGVPRRDVEQSSPTAVLSVNMCRAAARPPQPRWPSRRGVLAATYSRPISLSPQRRVLGLLAEAFQSVMAKGIFRRRGGGGGGGGAQVADLIALNNIRRRLSEQAGMGEGHGLETTSGQRGSIVNRHVLGKACVLGKGSERRNRFR
ncbi:hypothetical protein CGRA01v4_10534 [Colletotrichum graminicola]|nr:hypothetical protein CGRA01v4_10534 [Colletotrichum graminicola]